VFVLVVFVLVFVLVVFVFVLVVVRAGFGKFYRIDVVAKSDYFGFVRAGIVQQLFQPAGFQSQPNRHHGISVRNHRDITSAGY
jgi:hypothetical protein